jgi:L-ascorbate metabolism protein UlaG (beta-lactamase superfamily)
MTTKLTLVGGPTALIDFEGLTVLTDPTFDAPGEYPIPGGVLVKNSGPAIAATDLPPIDLITLSHAHHPDNLDSAGANLLNGASTVVGTPFALEQVPHLTALIPWESTTITAHAGDFAITAVPARHGPEGCEEITGDVAGFVITAPSGRTLYISGDNAALELVRDIRGRFEQIDIAVLFTGAARVGLFDNAPLTLTAEMAAEASSILNAPVVFPVHSEGWAHFSEDRALLESAFSASGQTERLRLVQPGGSVTV